MLREKINPLVFFILIIFIFLDSWGRSLSEGEIKKAWTETGYSFEILFEDLGVEHCYKSEKRFSACLMAFHGLLSTAKKGESYQLMVSESDKLEIIPFSGLQNVAFKDIWESESGYRGVVDKYMESEAKRRESFRLLFQTRLPDPKEFHDIVQQILEFTEKIPLKDRSKIAGGTYNVYLSESFDPDSSLSPVELGNSNFKEDSVGIGVYLLFHKIRNGKTTWSVSPYKNSPAENAGLKKGDLILSIDDFDIGDLPVSMQTKRNLLDRLRGREGTEVRLKILSICDNNEKEIRVTRGRFRHTLNWIETHRYISLTQQEPLDCETEKPSSEFSRKMGNRFHPLNSVLPILRLFIWT